jgi:hypothetical protein
LLCVARSIERIVGVQGGIDPLESMAPDLTGQVAEDLLALAVDVQALFPRGWCKETAALPATIPSAEVGWQPAQP